jgi:hypothetical protein
MQKATKNNSAAFSFAGNILSISGYGVKESPTSDLGSMTLVYEKLPETSEGRIMRLVQSLITISPLILRITATSLS